MIAHARLDADQPPLAIRLPVDARPPQAGETVGLRIQSDRIHLFDAQGRALAA